MATTRYRFNENPTGTSLVKDTSGYYEFSLVTSAKAGVTSPIPKEGQRCRSVTGATSSYTADTVGSSVHGLNVYSYLDFYFYNSSSANTDWRIHLFEGWNDFLGASTYQWSWIKQSTNEVIVSSWDGATYGEISMGANNIPRNQWSRIVVNIGIDYGGGYYGFANKVSFFKGTNINGTVPDYSDNTQTGFSSFPFNIVIGQTGGEATSPSLTGGFYDDLIISDSIVYRKKAFVIG